MLAITKKKILGTGSFGIVFEEVWEGIPVAIKQIHVNDTTSSKREETALKTFHHENVIKLLHVEENQDFKYFFLQLCKATMAQLFLKDGDKKKYYGPMPPKVDVLYQLSIGLEYIHQKRFIHRDLKPENVLIWENSENNQVIMKWADFGLSKQINERGTCSMSTGIKGSPDWLAPEILEILLEEDGSSESESSTKRRGTIKSDVFTEGLVFGFFLLDGVHLFGPRTAIQSNILENKPINLKEIQPFSAGELIEKMVRKDPKKRMTSSGVAKQLKQLKHDMTFTFEGGHYPTVEEIEKLIKNGMDINCKNEKGFTPLLNLAINKIAGENVLEVIQCLITNGANVNVKIKGDWNVLHLFCHSYQNENLIEIIRILIKNKMEVNCKTINGSNALTLLCQNYRKDNLIDIIGLLIENGIDVNCKDKYGENALTLLCQYYQNYNLIKLIDILIENKVEVTCKTNGGKNALHILGQHCQNDNVVEIIKILLENKIEVNSKIYEGDNVLTLLCRNYQRRNLIDIIQLLIEFEIDVTCKDNNGSNALTLLSQFYQEDNLIYIMRLLINRKIDINCNTIGGSNSLTLLCGHYHNENLIEIIQLLIENGINVKHKDIDGSNALALLGYNYEMKNLKDIIQLLIRYGCEVTPKTRDLFKEKYHNENRNEILQLLD